MALWSCNHCQQHFIRREGLRTHSKECVKRKASAKASRTPVEGPPPLLGTPGHSDPPEASQLAESMEISEILDEDAREKRLWDLLMADYPDELGTFFEGEEPESLQAFYKEQV